jgi:hypothetical protein
MTRCLWTLVVGAGLLLSGQVLAWDTGLTDETPWLSMYKHPRQAPSIEGGVSGFTTEGNRNEHAELGDISLQLLGVGGQFSMRDGEPLIVTDLNASLFRPELKTMTSPGNVARTILEERMVPPPPHFTGVPDFSYTIYDWINKDLDRICPSLPESAPNRELCHSYNHWHGAALNSSHMGTQATNMFKRLHEVAIDLAKRARNMRLKLEKSDKPGDIEAHGKFVREAELMALYYEGYAQHFFQDRWAIGHMWERWNAGGYEKIAYPESVMANRSIGVFTGLLHGAQAMTEQTRVIPPDPLSSPATPLLGDPVPMQWAHGRKGDPRNGVGDRRLVDLFDGQYGKEYFGKDVPLGVQRQRSEMLSCLMAGWAEVIREFGKYGSGYGIHEAPLADIPGIDGFEFGCFDMWATNWSVGLGWDGGLAGIGGLETLFKDIGVWPSHTLSLMRLEIKITRLFLSDPNGTGLARHRMGDIGRAKQGNEYGADFVPAYVVPGDLDRLPDKDDLHGKDKQAVFGFFNRAHADYWCQGGPETDIGALLARYRGSTDETEKEVCRYLAERVHAGTDPLYDGVQKEIRTIDGKKGSAATNPICRHFGIAPTGYDEGLPVHLHPGYVGFLGTFKPYDRALPIPYAVAPQSIANWCDKVPVLDAQDDLRDEDVVVELKEDAKPTDVITVRGHNLGSQRGRLMALDGPSSRTPLTIDDIEGWSDTAIRFRLPEDSELRSGTHYLKVSTANGQESVGRFVITAPKPVAYVAKVRIAGTDGDAAYEAKLIRDGRPGDHKRKIDPATRIGEVVFLPYEKGPWQLEVTYSKSMGRLDVEGKPPAAFAKVGDEPNPHAMDEMPGSEFRVFTRPLPPLPNRHGEYEVPILLGGIDENGNPIDGDPLTVARPDPGNPSRWLGWEREPPPQWDETHRPRVRDVGGILIGSLLGGEAARTIHGANLVEFKPEGGARPAVGGAAALSIAKVREIFGVQGDVGVADPSVATRIGGMSMTWVFSDVPADKKNPKVQYDVELSVTYLVWPPAFEPPYAHDLSGLAPKPWLSSTGPVRTGSVKDWTIAGTPFQAMKGYSYCYGVDNLCQVDFQGAFGNMLVTASAHDLNHGSSHYSRQQEVARRQRIDELLTGVLGILARNLANVKFAPMSPDAKSATASGAPPSPPIVTESAITREPQEFRSRRPLPQPAPATVQPRIEKPTEFRTLRSKRKRRSVFK